jgi:hypothetical protein
MGDNFCGVNSMPDGQNELTAFIQLPSYKAIQLSLCPAFPKERGTKDNNSELRIGQASINGFP